MTTKKDICDALDAAGVEYDVNAKKDELQTLADVQGVKVGESPAPVPEVRERRNRTSRIGDHKPRQPRWRTDRN